MKAISIRQPWASLIADGHKRFESRGWSTSYRGPLLVCAAKRRLKWDTRDIIVRSWLPEELWDYFYDNTNRGFEPTQRRGRRRYSPRYHNLPFGKALCIVNLEDCHEIVSFLGRPAIPSALRVLTDKEIALGDYRAGRFAWQLSNVRRFVTPWPVIGRQRLFEVPDEEIAEHELEAA